MKKRALSGKCLCFIFLILIFVFFLLGFVGFFSMNSLVIFVKQTEVVRKPFALLFIGIVLLAFIILCVLHRRNIQKR